MSTMTLEQVMALSPDEVRVKVAEACGWIKLDNASARGLSGVPVPCDGRYLVPAYTADLNAIQSAIGEHITWQHQQFGDRLVELLIEKHDIGEDSKPWVMTFCLATAEALDLCRAFLLVKGATP